MGARLHLPPIEQVLSHVEQNGVICQCIIRYVSQVSYGIPQICRIGFPRNSARQLADFRESSVESLETIRRNIAGYPRNLRMYLRNDPLKGSCGTFEGDCTVICARFTQSLWTVGGRYLGYEYASE